MSPEYRLHLEALAHKSLKALPVEAQSARDLLRRSNAQTLQEAQEEACLAVACLPSPILAGAALCCTVASVWLPTDPTRPLADLFFVLGAELTLSARLSIPTDEWTGLEQGPHWRVKDGLLCLGYDCRQRWGGYAYISLATEAEYKIAQQCPWPKFPGILQHATVRQTWAKAMAQLAQKLAIARRPAKGVLQQILAVGSWQPVVTTNEQSASRKAVIGQPRFDDVGAVGVSRHY